MSDADLIKTLLVLIPALPLAATLVVALFGKYALGERSHWPVFLAFAGSFALSLALLAAVNREAKATVEAGAGGAGYESVVTLWTWAEIPAEYTQPADHPGAASHPGDAADRTFNFSVDVTLRADPLTAIMLSMVTFISTLVVIYASGYMHGDPGYWRFFTYVSLFVFSMTMLVSVSNFVLLYVFWEAVGLCSYLLIGFWFERPAAAAAGKKAFLVNRIGDFGFALGVFLIWTVYGTINFHDTPAGDGTLAVAGVLGQTRLTHPTLFVGGAMGLGICLCLFLGACGKSAQFPLHVWLPDAMEGPTPVSALIHAATMVTAGVYMVVRCTPLFVAAPDAQQVVAVIGAFTALLAGLIAVTQTDLKRVLAYSTVSQLGYMFLGLGVGTLAGVTAGMFHLFTHAFFKALLFLGAGSVMHAMGNVIDMRQFSGLRRLMPRTCWTFWFGSLALAGIVPFAGFWSKDAIVAAVYERSDGSPLYGVLLYGALFTALLTSFYTFRALFLTFYGDLRVPPEAGHHAHESPPAMTVPLVILAVCALVVGAWFEWTHGFADFLALTPSLAYAPMHAGEHGHHGFHWGIAALSTAIAVAGLGAAAFLYLGDRREVERIARWAKSAAGLKMYHVSHHKFFFDQIYDVLIVRPLHALARLAYWFDRWIIDGLVNLVGRTPPVFGAFARALQNGMVQFYALAMVLGTIVLLAAILLWPPGGME